MPYLPDSHEPGPRAHRAASSRDATVRSNAGKPNRRRRTAATQSAGLQHVTRRYRRAIGGWWWFAVTGVPLLFTVLSMTLGGGELALVAANGEAANRAINDGPPGGYVLARNAQSLILTATVPDENAKQSLLEQVRANVGADVQVVDAVTISTGAVGPDPAPLSALAARLSNASAYQVDYDGTVLTLTGTVPDKAAKTAAKWQARRGYPQANVRNLLDVGEQGKKSKKGKNKAARCTKIGQTVAGLTTQTKIDFATKKDRLTPDSQRQLQRIANEVKQCSGTKLLVAGHTDNVGNQSRNKSLSLRRAETIKQQLVRYGVPPADVEAVGHGSTNPIADNDTETGRKANRRVDITVR